MNNGKNMVELQHSIMKRIRVSHIVAIFVFLVLIVGFSLTTWNAHKLRNVLLEYIDNERWQQTLTANRMYDGDLIVFFGDSQIYFWPMATSFGSLPIVNKGIRSDTALRAIDRFDNDVLGLKPKVLVILLGTNDLADGQPIEKIIGDIELMIEKAKNYRIRTIVCSLLPVRGRFTNSRPSKDILTINNKLNHLSLQYEADYVDFFSRLRDREGQFGAGLTLDGLHPSAAGYFRMTKTILPYLMKHLQAAR
jgi:lysophospholipase L1-like esterase